MTELVPATPPQSGFLTPAHLATLGDDERVQLLAEAFLRGRASPQTERSYRASLTLWLAYCRRFGLAPLTDPLGVHVEGWMHTLAAEGASPATVRTRVGAVSSWYVWLVRDGRADRNPAVGVDRPSAQQAESVTIGLDREQAQAWLEAIRTDTHSQTDPVRNLAIATLLLNNALRCGDIIGLDLDDLGQSRGHRTIRVLGKGATLHTIPLAPASTVALDAYLADRGDEPGPLFRTAAGRPLDQKALWRLVRRAARQAARLHPGIGMDLVAARISPHSLRHTAITAALDAGVTLRDVQAFARHADPKTTMGYDRNRNSLDRHATYQVAAFFAADGGETDGETQGDQG